MAKQKTILTLSGTLGDITYYIRKGKFLARKRTSLNGERIKTDEAYQNMRENMNEFGASSMAGKALREGLSAVIKEFGDWKISGRLTKIFLQIAKQGNGLKGKRSIEILPNKNFIVNFELNEINLFKKKFTAPYSVSANVQRNNVAINIPSFDTNDFIKTPSGCTHFRLVGCIGAVSDYFFNTSTRKYEAAQPSLNGLGANDRSAEIGIGATTPAINLNMQLSNSLVLPSTVGLVVCLGIEFLQFSNGNYFLMTEQGAMKIVEAL